MIPVYEEKIGRRAAVVRRLVNVGIAVLSGLAVQGVAAPAVAANCDNIQILSQQLSSTEAQAYCSYAMSERQKVERFWGATWKKPIRIHVGGGYEIAYGKPLEALEKEWRAALQ
jgi:hypothetical protein